MHKKIKEIFNKIDLINVKFKRLEDMLSKVNNSKFTKEFNQIKNKYENGSDLTSIYDALTTFIKKISDYVKQEEAAAALYNTIFKRYYAKLAQVPSTNDNTIRKETQLFINFNELFKRYQEGELSFEKLMMLQEIKFLDLQHDEEVIESIINKDKKNKVYIDMNMGFDFVLIIGEGVNKKGSYYEINSIFKDYNSKCKKDDFEYYFIPLEEALKYSEFIGRFFSRRFAYNNTYVHGTCICKINYNNQEKLIVNINNSLYLFDSHKCEFGAEDAAYNEDTYKEVIETLIQEQLKNNNTRK